MTDNAPMKDERTKQQERAEDIAYTINHSVYCTATDFLNPPINAATDGYLRWLIPGCGHDHSQDGEHHHEHGASCSHHHAPPENLSRWEKVKFASKQTFNKNRLLSYVKGEFIGDFGAVPITIAAQRMFPDFMTGLRAISEPVVRPLFSWGIAHDNAAWAKEHNVSKDSPEAKAHAASVYDYEINHFPQAIVWTGASLGLNTAYQVYADKSPMLLERKLALKSGSVLSGILVTAGVVVAARALAPNTMHGVDQWTSEHAIIPTTNAINSINNIKEEKKNTSQTMWQQKIDTPPKKLSLSI